MKTKLFPIFAVSAILLNSCFLDNKQNSISDSVTDTDYTQAETPAPPQKMPKDITYNLSDSIGPLLHTDEGDKRPSLSVKINLSLKGGDVNSQTEVEKQLCELFTGKQHCSLQEGVKQYGDSTAVALSTSLENLYSDPEIKMDFPYEFLHEVTGYFASTTHPQTLGYKIKTITYEGGAHGGYFERWYNFNRKSGKIILANQAFDMTRIEDIKSAIRSQLCKDYKRNNVEELQDNEGILVMGDVFISDSNFILLQNGVQFLYNPYEIGPWAVGKIEVKIPYTQLKGLCNFSLTQNS